MANKEQNNNSETVVKDIEIKCMSFCPYNKKLFCPFYKEKAQEMPDKIPNARVEKPQNFPDVILNKRKSSPLPKKKKKNGEDEWMTFTGSFYLPQIIDYDKNEKPIIKTFFESYDGLEEKYVPETVWFEIYDGMMEDLTLGTFKIKPISHLSFFSVENTFHYSVKSVEGKGILTWIVDDEYDFGGSLNIILEITYWNVDEEGKKKEKTKQEIINAEFTTNNSSKGGVELSRPYSGVITYTPYTKEKIYIYTSM